MKEVKVAIIGQIAKWKGQDIFIKAAKLLHKKFPSSEFLIIGDVLFDKEEERLFKEKLLKDTKGYNFIKFLGYKNNINEEIKKIDVIVHASIRPEPFGRIIIEGMAAKKPVVASGIGGPLEIIEHGVSGIIFDPGNPYDLADAIESLLTNESIYKEIAIGGYNRFLEKFDLKMTVAEVEKYIELTSNKRMNR